MSLSLANQVFVFAGFKDETLKAQIEAAGGKVTTTITKSVTKMLAKYLAKKNGNGELKKMEEAKKHDVDVMLLDEFVAEHGFELGDKKPRGRPPKSSDDEAEKDEPKASPKAESEKPAKPVKAPKAPKATKAEKPINKNPIELLNSVVYTLATNEDKKEAIEALDALKALIMA